MMSILPDSNKLVTALVSDFYNRFPYPPDQLKEGPPPGSNWRWSVDAVYAACTGSIAPVVDPMEPIRILDAGCGTGVSTDYLAHLNPGVEILAVDISSGALEVAQERVRMSGGDELANITFKNQSLLEIQNEGTFNYINSVGVLHHLNDPLEGIKSLESLLRYGGILHLFLYSEGGRWAIQRVKKALSLLGIDSEEDNIKLARRLLSELPLDNDIRMNYEKHWELECSSDVGFADTYFHPHEANYSFKKLMNLIDSTSLEFIDFSNPRIWDLERFLKGDILLKAKSMNRIKQYELVETLDPNINHFEFFLSKGNLQRYEWKEDEHLLSAKAKINPCILGWPGHSLYDSDLNQIEISADCLELLNTLEKKTGTPLGLLPISLEKDQITSLARDLHAKQVLLLYP